MLLRYYELANAKVILAFAGCSYCMHLTAASGPPPIDMPAARPEQHSVADSALQSVRRSQLLPVASCHMELIRCGAHAGEVATTRVSSTESQRFGDHHAVSYCHKHLTLRAWLPLAMRHVAVSGFCSDEMNPKRCDVDWCWRCILSTCSLSYVVFSAGTTVQKSRTV
jgi:hypothetical protein